MTLPEWTTTIVTECRVAGWDVSEHQGFPLVKRPTSLAEGVRFLEHRFSLPVERHIYAEGCLLLPLGSDQRRRDLEAL